MTSLSTQKKETSRELDSLENKIETRAARIAVMGLGYVGLPLAVEFAKAGFSVEGFEVDPGRIRRLNAGESYIADVPGADVRALVEKKRFVPTTNFSRLQAADVVIICVPTPLRKTKDPDVSFIIKATEQIARTLHRQQLVVLESTTYPGTTQELMLPALQANGLRVGGDFYLAFSPERIDPGNAKFNLKNTPKVVGGITPKCRDLATLLYGTIVDRVVPVSSADAAEMVKLLENTFRLVNIGLVNEIALICDRLKLNVWEIINAAATKPYGFMPFYPGPGLGGHCIPVDPHYLSWKLKGLNFKARFIELADEVNSRMPEFVLGKTVLALNERKKCLNGSNILLLGVAYKADVSDVRESPALDLIHLLNEQGARVSFHDPFVHSVESAGLQLKGRPYSTALLKSMDAVILLTTHSQFDIKEIAEHAPLLIDTRGAAQSYPSDSVIPL